MADHASTQRRFDRLVRLTACALRAPMAMLAVVGPRAQRVTAHLGMPRMVLARGSTLVPALCGELVTRGPLAIDDLVAHPLGRRSPLVTTGVVGAFAGAPVYGADPEPVGFVCVLGAEARRWGLDERELLQDLAAAIGVELRAHERDEALGELLGGLRAAGAPAGG